MSSNFQSNGQGNVQNNTSGKKNRVKTKVVNHNYAAPSGPARPVLTEKRSIPLVMTSLGSGVAGWISAATGVGALAVSLWPTSATAINNALPLPDGLLIVLGLVMFALGILTASFAFRARKLIKSGLRAFPSSRLLPAVAPLDGRLRLVYYQAECPACPAANKGKLHFRNVVIATTAKVVKGEIQNKPSEWQAQGFCNRIPAHKFTIDPNA